MEIGPLSRISAPAVAPKTNQTSPTAGNAFGEVLTRLTEDVTAKQRQADALVLKAATGEPMELHEAILAMEQTGLSVHLALQVRNKLIEAYQEVMRMQI